MKLGCAAPLRGSFLPPYQSTMMYVTVPAAATPAVTQPTTDTAMLAS